MVLTELQQQQKEVYEQELSKLEEEIKRRNDALKRREKWKTTGTLLATMAFSQVPIGLGIALFGPIASEHAATGFDQLIAPIVGGLIYAAAFFVLGEGYFYLRDKHTHQDHHVIKHSEKTIGYLKNEMHLKGLDGRRFVLPR